MGYFNTATCALCSPSSKRLCGGSCGQPPCIGGRKPFPKLFSNNSLGASSLNWSMQPSQHIEVLWCVSGSADLSGHLSKHALVRLEAIAAAARCPMTQVAFRINGCDTVRHAQPSPSPGLWPAWQRLCAVVEYQLPPRSGGGGGTLMQRHFSACVELQSRRPGQIPPWHSREGAGEGLTAWQ